MKKLDFIFTSFSSGCFQCCKRCVKRLTPRGSKSMIAKATAILGLAAASYLPAASQCHTFTDANAANPLRKLIPADAYNTAVDFMDIDGDGDLDCYTRVGYSTSINFFKNTGTAERPVYEAGATTGFEAASLPQATHYMQFVDIDGDGDYDCFMSGYTYFYYGTTRIQFFENQGTATTPHFVENEAKNPVAFATANRYVPFTFADIDGDGDLDFSYQQAIIWEGYGVQYSYRNTGTKKEAVYVYASEEFKDGVNTRTYYDWNKDGLLDYFDIRMSRFDYNDASSINYYKNTGPKTSPHYVLDNEEAPSFVNGFPYRLVDLNSDGAPESFTAGAYYGTLSPVAAIGVSQATVQNHTITRLFSKERAPGYSYQWAFNGKALPQATYASIYALKPGSYTLFVTDQCGTGVSLPYTIGANNNFENDKMITDLPGASMEKTIVKAYPNPFTQSFTVQLPSSKTANSTLRITDIAGRVLLSQSTTASTLTIGNTLQKGTYLLQVWQNGTVVYTTKLVKQ